MATTDSKVTGLDSNAIYYEVSPTIICIMRLYNSLTLLMVLIAFAICLVKGKESESNYLLACNLVPETWNYADLSKPAHVELDTSSHGSWSSTNIATHDCNQPDTRDILDLERIAENMTEAGRDRSSTHIDEADLRRYTPLAEADFEEIRETDRLLEQAYDLYFARGLRRRAPRVKRKTKALIRRLESKPHFFCPYERKESTKIHVSRWLNNYTANPEKELIGFTSRDAYEPKRFIPVVEPRAVTSDSNVVLGKRKRAIDDEDTVCVSTSSSESRLVCDRSNRPKKMKRAR